MTECKPLLIALLGILSLTQASPAQALAPSLPTAEKLRRLLPFPDATLDPKMELSFGLGFSQEQGYHFVRQSSDYSAQIVAVRRQMTGGISDAARYRQLGGLYRQTGLLMKAHAALQQGAMLYRVILQKRPADGAALAGYGLTLKADNQNLAAEAYLRKAVQIAPRSADVRLALGAVLEDEASPTTEPTSHLMRQAAAAFDQAVALAPQNPAVWATRGQFRTWSLPQFRGKKSSGDGLSDYERAASLLPRNPDAQALVPTTDCFTFELAHHLYTSPKAAKMEPAASDHRAEGYLRRITAIAQDTYGAQAAEAYTARAWVQFEFFYDSKGAQKSLSLALQQNPHQRDAIDYQVHVAAVTGDDVLWAAACRRELRHRSELRLRVMLAEADFNLAAQKPKYWREGLTQMELAHAAAPRDYACALGLAAFLLESGQTARADLLLNVLEPQAKIRPKDQQTEYDLTRGIGAALAGENEHASAFFQLALKNDPNNQAARSALALLPAGNHRRTVTR